MVKTLLDMPRTAKRLFAMAVDCALCVFSIWLAFYLRLGEFLPLSNFLSFPLSLTIIFSVVFALPIFTRMGLYRAIFRYSGFYSMLVTAKAIGLYGLFFFTFFTFFGLPGVPRTVGIIQPLLFLAFVGVSRITARAWLGDHYINKLKRSSLSQVLIYGAGSAGRQLASGLANSNAINVVGFLDDDSRLHGQISNGLLIFDPKKIQELVSRKTITDIILAIPSASRERRNQILAFLAKAKISIRTLPDLTDIVSGKVTFTDLRDLDIHDLLGREPVKPDALLLSRNTLNKTVLVTGAGGSIGSELCRQVIKGKPKRLLLLDMSELALYLIHQEIQNILKVNQDKSEGCVELIPLLASACDEIRIHQIMATWKPNTVYHAAAYKHVPLVEHNPSEGVRNNVWSTKVCAEAAVQNNVQNFVLVSTDKAVRPTNIMGATKRLAEMVLQGLNDINSIKNTNRFANIEFESINKTCFSMVRFGNVLGSSGSVVPLFREQIKNGGPITLTHSEVTRYFMTIPEAAQLVIQAGAMSSGGDVFVLDMGDPVRIFDLASRIVELSGLTLKNESNPHGDIEIEVTGLRPGEKLYEEILIGDNPKPTQHPRILKDSEKFIPWDQLQEQLDSLNSALKANDVPVMKSLLKQLVPEYQPNQEVVDWVYLEQERLALKS